MKPIMIRGLEMADFSALGSAGVLRDLPADRYLYGHLGNHEPQVNDLVRSRRRVYRTLNILHAHAEAAGWSRTSWEGFLWDLAERRGLFLRTRGGELVRFPWFGRGPIYNWAAPGFWSGQRSAAAEVAEFLRGSQNCGDRWTDQVWPQLRTWMFLDPTLRIRDLADYDHDSWLRNLRLLLAAIGTRRRREPLSVNGWWDWDEQGLLATYENADTGSQARYLEKTLERWRQHPGTMLSINGLPQELHTRRVIGRWLRHGGVLWPEDVDTADLAWRMKGAVRDADEADRALRISSR